MISLTPANKYIRFAITLLLSYMVLTLPAFAAQREFNITIDEVQINVAPGLDYKVFGFNGQVPGPLLHVQEGDDLIVHVTNNTSLAHTFHWHGINQTNNWENDGVPDITQKQIEPGETFTYHIKAERPGSLWYHCHVNVHEHVALRGMWAPLIIDPKNPSALEKRVTKNVIMMLSTWDSNYGVKYGTGGNPTDMPNYFSINAKAFPLNQPVRVKKGDVVRFRFYGAGEGTHSMHLHGHDMLITHKDGYALPNPYYVDTIVVGAGERYDAIVEMKNPGYFIFHDHVDSHVTNNGMFPGGPITVVEYEGIKPKDYYPWKNVNYNPNFYYTESMKQGYGMFTEDAFKGTAVKAEHKKKTTDGGM